MSNESERPAERPHHPRSPSKLQFLEACPAYQSRDDVKHERAIAGTLAHKVTDTQIDDEKLGDDDATAVAECLDFVEARRQELDMEAEKAWEFDNECRKREGVPTVTRETFQVLEIREGYFPIDDCKYDDADSTTAGYADHVLISWDGTYAELIDWKFGMWKVEKAENNLQGIAYCLGLFRKFPRLQRVRFFFKQPHLEYITDTEIRREQVAELYLRVKTVCERAIEANRRAEKDDWSMARPHTPVCLFCARIGKCEPIIQHALRAAKKYHPLKFPDSILPHELTDPKKAALALELVAVLKVFCDGFRRNVTDRILRSGEEPPEGYELKHREGSRQIVDMAKFKEVVLHFMSEPEYISCLEAGFGTIEAKISEKSPRGTKKSTIEQCRQQLLESGAVAHGSPFSFLRSTGE